MFIGSVYDGRNYKILLVRVMGEEIFEIYFLSGKNDWEGYLIVRIEGGYMIGGVVEGKVMFDGGVGWKVYVVRFDEDLNVFWERKIEIRGNEVIYFIFFVGDLIFIVGDMGWFRNMGFFFGKFLMEGELEWLKDFGNWEEVVMVFFFFRERLRFIGSVKEECWKVVVFDFDFDGNFLDRVIIMEEGIVFIVVFWNDKFIFVGYKENDFWVWSKEWEVIFLNGVVILFFLFGDGFFVGGEVEGMVFVMEFSLNGEVFWKKFFWECGWVEVLGKDFVVGVKEEDGKIVMMVELIGEW